MKKIISLSLLLCLSIITYAQNIVFQDPNFEKAVVDIKTTSNPLVTVVDINNDGKISVQEASSVTYMNIGGSKIDNLSEISFFRNLKTLYLSGNNLKEIDISRNTKLKTLYVGGNKLTGIDLTQNTRLTDLDIRANKITSLDLSNNKILIHLNCNFNLLTQLDLTKQELLLNLEVVHNQLTSIDVTQNIGLNTFFCSNNQLSSLDVSKNTNLGTLNFSDNQISSMDVTQNTNLTGLVTDNNPLINIDLTQNKMLRNARLEFNNLTSLDLSQNSALTFLTCWTNQLTSLILPQNSSLTNLTCGRNQLKNIDFSTSTSLKDLRCSYNLLEQLDVRNCALKNISFHNNPNLTIAYLRNQKLKLTPFSDIPVSAAFSDCPKLASICVDPEYIVPFQDRMRVEPGHFETSISSRCEEVVHSISGAVTYDTNNNGCDANDIGFSDMKFSLSNFATGEFRDVFVSNSGAYDISLHEDGDYFMFPLLENPSYFNIDPSFDPSTTPTPISFPKDGSNIIKNFCITPDPTIVHNDLEVILFSSASVPPRPGFGSDLIVNYKNKGTSTQSGTITLEYTQNILQFGFSSNPNTIKETNKLSWNFTNLKPLESKEIKLIFIANKPTDNPPVNSGDILNYKATISSITTDETPDDNVQILNQEVVNSFDPNDKICLEGDTIEPKDVGGYLHYLIRFENKGTAEATKIVIKDDIDTSKLDIETFKPLKASHPFITVVNNKKEVEFIFNNINLPYRVPYNTGYVSFRIKTKTTLKEGDVINNKANIYFDFNAPIITDVETVTVKKKVAEQPSFKDYFYLSPNPTKGITFLKSVINNHSPIPIKGPPFSKSKNISIQYITIHDIVGRVVGYYPGTYRNFDFSHLFANTYFMQLHTDKGVLSTQFFKIN